jgi:hypothetical protein
MAVLGDILGVVTHGDGEQPHHAPLGGVVIPPPDEGRLSEHGHQAPGFARPEGGASKLFAQRMGEPW